MAQTATDGAIIKKGAISQGAKLCKVCSFTHTTSEFVENCRHKMLSFASFQHFFPQWRKVFHTSDFTGASVKILTLQIDTEVCKKRQ